MKREVCVGVFLVLFFFSTKVSLFSLSDQKRYFSRKKVREYNHLLENIRLGRVRFFQDATYEKVRSIVYFSKHMKSSKESILDYISGKAIEYRIQILNDLVLGLNNKDPRVRLISIDFLKGTFEFFKKIKIQRGL